MKCSWTLDKDSTGILTVEVEGEVWEKAQKKTFNKLKAGLNVKGFRKGQIPDQMAKKYIGKDHICAVAVDEVANEALQEGIKEFKLDLVTRPSLDVKEIDEKKRFSNLHAQFPRK